MPTEPTPPNQDDSLDDSLDDFLDNFLENFLEEWHRIVEQRDLEALDGMLAEDVTLGAPPYWDKLQGRAMVHHLLGLIVTTIEDFTYHREWHEAKDGAAAELALEFRGHLGDLDLQGIDLISLDAEGRLRNLDVMIRPINAVNALRDVVVPQMAAFLAAREDG